MSWESKSIRSLSSSLELLFNRFSGKPHRLLTDEEEDEDDEDAEEEPCLLSKEEENK